MYGINLNNISFDHFCVLIFNFWFWPSEVREYAYNKISKKGAQVIASEKSL